MKILVTGGAGFIGSNFLNEMCSIHNEDEFCCLDALTYAGNLENIKVLLDEGKVKFFKGNICDENFVDDIFSKEKFDVVVNFAAESHVDRSIENSNDFLNSNIKGVQVLMNACLRFGASRFHQISTDEVYGDAYGIEKSPDENAPLRPSSPYAATKAAADLLVLSFVRTYGLKATISRCANNYGPYQYPEKLIPLMIYKALKNEALPVYGDGENERDWISVSDNCKAIDFIIRKGQEGEIYNISSGDIRKNIDVVKRILQIVGKPESLITYVPDRLGHDRRYGMNANKIISKLGWKPVRKFDEEFEKTVRWYVDKFQK